MAGHEQKIANDVKNMANKNLNKFIEDALVPCKQIIKIKKGQKVQESQKLFPGYVFIKANLNSDAYNVINSIPKVMGFLGGKNNPQPVEEKKMKDILALINNENVESGKSQIFEIGETLSVIEGPFESFSGNVEDFDAEKQKVRISILIFGRATSVELDVNQVEKLTK